MRRTKSTTSDLNQDTPALRLQSHDNVCMTAQIHINLIQLSLTFSLDRDRHSQIFSIFAGPVCQSGLLKIRHMFFDDIKNQLIKIARRKAKYLDWKITWKSQQFAQDCSRKVCL